MTKPKTKTIVKYAVLAYLLYLLISLPKKDWDNSKIIALTDDAGKTVRYIPKTSSFIPYTIAWWKSAFKTKGLSGLIDEHIIAPLGISVQ